MTEKITIDLLDGPFEYNIYADNLNEFICTSANILLINKQLYEREYTIFMLSKLFDYFVHNQKYLTDNLKNITKRRINYFKDKGWKDVVKYGEILFPEEFKKEGIHVKSL